MKLEDYSDEDFDRFFDEVKKREREKRRNPVTIGTIVKLARDRGYSGSPAAPPEAPMNFQAAQSFDLGAAIPVFHPNGMASREFAGPSVGGAKLFPLKAISLFSALGGGGKTSTLVKLACHMAAGKAWGSEEVGQRKVLILSVEESKEELDRKLGAAVDDFSDADKERVVDNLRMVSLVGTDPRLTRIVGRSVEGTEITQKIIATAQQFNAEVIILDHLQGFADGDLNNSDTATALARAANCIVSATGAAVVMAAHTNKSNIGAQVVSNGFTTGSLAFENAARQVMGIIPLPDADAKSLGLEAVRRDFMLIAMPKNSYGPSGENAYLRKVYVADFHTVTVEPFHPMSRIAFPSASERLKQTLAEHIRDNPHSRSKNAIEKQAGKKGTFKASKAEVRAALGQLIEEGILRVKTITKEEKKAHGYPHQTKEVYEHV